MPRNIDEIMNRELLAVVLETPAQAIRELMRSFRVSTVPVLDERRQPVGMVTARDLLDSGGTAADQMTHPAVCVEGSTAIDKAARRMAKTDTHHLVVVDGAGSAVGIVSVLDVLRASYGFPVHHPASFPHWDSATHSSWTDEWPLEEDYVARAPEAAGVLALVRGLSGETDAIIWVEACANLRERVAVLTALSSSAEPALARLLERRDLRFRATVVRSEADRERITHGMRSDIEHRPPPGGT